MKSKRIRKNRYKDTAASKAADPGKWRFMIAMAAKIAGLILLVLIMSLIFMFGHDMVTQWDYLKAQTIIVTGNSRMSVKEIEKIAGIYKGVNILSVNMALARKKLLAVPWIRKVDIRRDYPSAMAIHVVENHPQAIVDFGRFFLINAEGSVFLEVKPSDFPSLPVVSGVAYSDWNQDRGQTRAFHSVMSVLNLVEKGAVPFKARDLKQINVDPETGVTLLTETVVAKIRLGFGKYKEKVRRMEKVLSLPETIRRFSTFDMMDLRNPERVVARPQPLI